MCKSFVNEAEAQWAPISRGLPVLRHTPPGCHQALQGTGGVGGAGGGKADGWTPGAWQKMPLVQLVGLLAVGVDAADGGGGENGADVIGNHLGNAAVRGAADGTGGHHIPQGHPMGQKEAPPLLHRFRNQPLPRRRIPCHQVRAFSAEDAGQHLPEAVAGVAVKEELLPGADGGKAPQNQDAGVGVKHRRDGMGVRVGAGILEVELLVKETVIFASHFNSIITSSFLMQNFSIILAIRLIQARAEIFI